MKVIILAGGYGTRLAEYTDTIPKPMVTIGEKPIIWHIMNHYALYGHNDFFVALGYKSEVVKNYFLNYHSLNSDFTVDLSTGATTPHLLGQEDWKVTLVNTGYASMTGGRVKLMQPYIDRQTCMLTYGDGVSDIDIDALVKFHKSHGKMVTISAVRPGARFGEIQINDGHVLSFKEKPQTGQGWINGGFMVVEPSFFELINGNQTVLEEGPLEEAALQGELMAFCHEGFWQCMDTKRDRDLLENLWQSGDAPWIINTNKGCIR